MKRFIIDISSIYNDHRKKAFIAKKPSWKYVSCLQEHIRFVFKIKEPIHLVNEAGIFFPDAEDIDVILDDETLIIQYTNTSKLLHDKSTSHVTKASKVALSAAVLECNGTRSKKNIPINCSYSNTDSDDKTIETSPTQNVVVQSEEPIQDESKSKRKRIRKRKNKSKDEESPKKVVIKMYGKNKLPSIAQDGQPITHIRFSEEEKNDQEEVKPKIEKYMNLNRITVPRVIKAVAEECLLVEDNQEMPTVPEYEDVPTVNLDEVNNARENKPTKKKVTTSVQVKQEMIERNTARSPSPTWDEEMDEQKEKFIANYCGEEFWSSFQQALENFPFISVPSINDIITFQQSGLTKLAFVEDVTKGDSEDYWSLNLALRLLNENSPQEKISVAHNELSSLRLIASYQT